MLGTYLYKFTLPNGRQVFIPSDLSRETGIVVHKEVRRRWRPPGYFYHLRRGGHLAALDLHLDSTTFAMLDIRGFFDSVTRSKIHRALRQLGFHHRRAWEIACESTVEKTRRAKDFSLPYGFIQSPVLASLALDRSALGRKMRNVARSNHTRLSSYMDDIILSGFEADAVEASRSELIEAADLSGFKFNLVKSQPLGPEIRAFNIHLSHGSRVIADERLAKFEDDMLRGELSSASAIIAYARGVNHTQGGYLARVALNAPDAAVRAHAASLMR